VLRRLRLLMRTSTTRAVLLGAESSGKSSLAAALTGCRSRAENLAGSTVAVETYRGGDLTVIDTPGLLHAADTAASAATLAALDDGEAVLLTVRASHLDEELQTLAPLVAGRAGAVAVTNWDRVVPTHDAVSALRRIGVALGVPVVPTDARRAGPDTDAVRSALAAPGVFTHAPLLERAGWRVEPPRTLLEHARLGPPLGLLLLLAPPVAAVWLAITAADTVEPYVERALQPAADAASRLPTLPAAVLAGDYGLLTMGPLLLVWALPVVLVLAVLLGTLKASGLLDRLTTAVHPLVRAFGLTGRDLVRVVAGHGCNVPAVIATRSCSTCTRDATIGAIAFGSACSYQLAATLGVLAAARRPGLVVPYLAILLAAGLLHARGIARTRGSSPATLDISLLHGRAFLSRPRLADVRREAATTLSHVTGRAVPIFLAITVSASLLAALGAIDALGRVLAPVLSVLRLPAEAALPVAFASIRKDGLLLLSEPSTVTLLDDAQLLAALLLAGALVPCLVTALTIARERGMAVAGRLLARQALAALVLAAAVSWAGVVVVGR
jgi:ferrous iron transport protein B